MDAINKKDAKTLSETRRKAASAALTARYAELDRLTGQTAAERIKELNAARNAGK
jgi:hypothetical protein